MNEVPTSDGQVAVDVAALRDVADFSIASMRTPAQDLEATRSWRHEAEQQPQESRLATTVRAEHRHELSGVHGEGGVSPDQLVAVGGAQAIGDDGGSDRPRHAARYCRLSAAWRAASCVICQSWKVEAAGWTVSEMPTTGMPFRVASCLRLSVIGVEVWVLYTSTLIWWCEIWSWNWATVCAGGSVPSEIACMNSGGEIRFRPNACAR